MNMACIHKMFWAEIVLLSSLLNLGEKDNKRSGE